MPRKNAVAQATILNPNETAFTADIPDDNDVYLFGDFGGLAHDLVFEPCKFWCVSPEFNIRPIQISEQEEDLLLIEVECEELDESFEIAYNRLKQQANDVEAELFINGLINPVLRLHKTGKLNAKGRNYPELYVV